MIRKYIRENKIPMLFNSIAACNASVIEFTFNIVKTRYTDLYDAELRKDYYERTYESAGDSIDQGKKLILQACSTIDPNNNTHVSQRIIKSPQVH